MFIIIYVTIMHLHEVVDLDGVANDRVPPATSVRAAAKCRPHTNPYCSESRKTLTANWVWCNAVITPFGGVPLSALWT
jgi:hypothetical protein